MGLRKTGGERQGWGGSRGPAEKALQQPIKELGLVVWAVRTHQKQRLVNQMLIGQSLCELNRYHSYLVQTMKGPTRNRCLGLHTPYSEVGS